MTKVKKPLTVKELEPFVQDYHHEFQGWQILERTLIVRECGPVMQGIGFQCLSTGRYRPICSIYYLCVPNRDAGFGVQFLKHPVQDIDPRAHERLRDKVVEAIHREIIPSVDAPLDPEQVLELHESRQPIRSPDAYDLAALNAYLGHNERALYWCKRFPELVNEHGLGWQEFDHKRQAFLTDLKQWIEAGQAKEQLGRIVQEERRHWGLA
jgi:hypothetical protein